MKWGNVPGAVDPLPAHLFRILCFVAKEGIPINPPEEWFSPPSEGIPTDKRITITAEGQVFGYIALWNTCHVGMSGCVKPPKGSPTDYSYAHQGETMTASGELIKTAVIGGGLGHAPVDAATANVPAYYENTGTQLMRVRYGEDSNGLWFAGALWPNVSDLQVAGIRASSISGDWRWHAAWRKSGGGFDFAGACLVNIPGFPMPSAGGRENIPGDSYSLAASMSPFINIDVNSEYIVSNSSDMVDLSNSETDMTESIVAGALPYQASTKDAVGTPWDGPKQVAAANGKSELRRMHAWVDPNGDPNAKSSYKLPHHDANGNVNLRGVHAAMAALLGARGGVQIPEADRVAVYRHLAKHYLQFGEHAPALHASASDGCDGSCTECTCGNMEDTVSEENDAVDDLTDEEISDIISAAMMSVKKKKKTLYADAASTDSTSSDSNVTMSDADRIAALENIVASVIQDNKELRSYIENIQAQELLDQLSS